MKRHLVRVGLGVAFVYGLAAPLLVGDRTGAAVFGDSLLVLAVILFVSVAAAHAGRVLVARAPEQLVVDAAPRSRPPDGLDPTQTALLANGSVDPTSCLIATLMHLRRAGLITITRFGSIVRITGTDNESLWAGTDRVARAVGRRLGVDTAGANFFIEDSAGPPRMVEASDDLLYEMYRWGPTKKG